MNFLRVKPNAGETARLVSVNNGGVYVLTREWIGFWKVCFVDNNNCKTTIGGGWSHPNEAKEAAKAHARTR